MGKIRKEQGTSELACESEDPKCSLAHSQGPKAPYPTLHSGI